MHNIAIMCMNDMYIRMLYIPAMYFEYFCVCHYECDKTDGKVQHFLMFVLSALLFEASSLRVKALQ